MVKFQFVEDEKPIEIVRLTPPKTTILESFDYDNIDFHKIAESSEFKRFIYMLRTGKTHRGTKVDLDQKLRKTEQEISMVKDITRGSKLDFREVVSELKIVLEKRKAKIELT